MSASRYSLTEHWNSVEKNYQQFISSNIVLASNKEDEDAYELARNTMEEMLAIGRRAEAISFWRHPLEKAHEGLKTKTLFSSRFGLEEVPPIKGRKSLAFLKDIILPHMEGIQKIEHEKWLIWLCSVVGINLAAETAHAGELSERYRTHIALISLDLNKQDSNSRLASLCERPTNLIKFFILGSNTKTAGSATNETSADNQNNHVLKR